MIRALTTRSRKSARKAGTLVPLLLVASLLFLMIGLGVDTGIIVSARTRLQVAADRSAVAAASSMGQPYAEVFAAAQQCAGHHAAAGNPVLLTSDDVQYGIWDRSSRRFLPTPGPGNAVRVTARCDDNTLGRVPLVFARLFGKTSTDTSASAVATATPRDMAFVVDLSGSMNDDTEPCRSAGAINGELDVPGHSAADGALMQQIYNDFGFGEYPGMLECVGRPLEIAGDRDAYAWIIDHQIARLMPAARPIPNSADADSRAYWQRYLDYVIHSEAVARPVSGGAGAGSVPEGFRNKIGYRTYVQFMMDCGRDLRPVGSQYVPLSRNSPHCPWHSEATAGGTFGFPPREQPMHAVRRAMIAAMQSLKDRNTRIAQVSQRDWVSIITFDTLTGGGPVLEQPLGGDYDAAMRACARLQAVGDKAATTATEAGLIAARQHLRPRGQGGQGREAANKVVVLLTDGPPDLYVSSRRQIDRFIGQNPDPDFYGGGQYAKNAVLMQALGMKTNRWYIYPVGVGLGCDDDFMDRLARMGATADDDGHGPRGSRNPAECERRLTEILEGIVAHPKVRLVQ